MLGAWVGCAPEGLFSPGPEAAGVVPWPVVGVGVLGFFVRGFPAFHFLGAAVFLMTCHLLSGWAATKVRARSQEAVRELLDLKPDTARRIADGEEREVPASEVEEGQRLRVNPGESVPLDGTVVDGHSTVDESVVTGEPIPAEKAEGDEVIGGSVNQAGTLVVEVTKTGDGERTGRAVAEEVGIDRVLAGVLPDETAEEVGRLQQEGRRVAFVGDGINDAPALTRADVGVAIGTGTDIAIESADVVLMHSRLSGVPDAFEVSRSSCRKTTQNLALAFSFDGVGVPVAATGLLHPVWAMGAMVASVSGVLANSFAGRLVGGVALA